MLLLKFFGISTLLISNFVDAAPLRIREATNSTQTQAVDDPHLLHNHTISTPNGVITTPDSSSSDSALEQWWGSLNEIEQMALGTAMALTGLGALVGVGMLAKTGIDKIRTGLKLSEFKDLDTSKLNEATTTWVDAFDRHVKEESEQLEQYLSKTVGKLLGTEDIQRAFKEKRAEIFEEAKVEAQLKVNEYWAWRHHFAPDTAAQDAAYNAEMDASKEQIKLISFAREYSISGAENKEVAAKIATVSDAVEAQLGEQATAEYLEASEIYNNEYNRVYKELQPEVSEYLQQLKKDGKNPISAEYRQLTAEKFDEVSAKAEKAANEVWNGHYAAKLKAAPESERDAIMEDLWESAQQIRSLERARAKVPYALDDGKFNYDDGKPVKESNEDISNEEDYTPKEDPREPQPNSGESVPNKEAPVPESGGSGSVAEAESGIDNGLARYENLYEDIRANLITKYRIDTLSGSPEITTDAINTEAHTSAMKQLKEWYKRKVAKAKGVTKARLQTERATVLEKAEAAKPVEAPSQPDQLDKPVDTEINLDSDNALDLDLSGEQKVDINTSEVPDVSDMPEVPAIDLEVPEADAEKALADGLEHLRIP